MFISSPTFIESVSFTSKVTVRNLFRYKKRFFMSVIGIAGSGALLVTAFGLNDSIFGIIEKQFGDIWQMDVQAYVYEAMPLADMQELLGKNPANDDFDSVMFCLDSQMECKNGGRSQSGVHLLGVESAGLPCRTRFHSTPRLCTHNDKHSYPQRL